MQLLFDRRITRQTPGRFRTRVLTEGVVPSLHVQYEKSKVNPYHKDGQALRAETTINDTYDFAIGRALRKLPALRGIGFAANRRLLRVESLGHDCLIGDDRLHTVTSPVVVHDQRVAGLASATAACMPSCTRSVCFTQAPTGCRHREFRKHVAPLQAQDPKTYSAGSMSYDLRRLRLHGLIERVPRAYRYQISDHVARRPTRDVLRSAPSSSTPTGRPVQPVGAGRSHHALDRLETALASFLQEVHLAA